MYRKRAVVKSRSSIELMLGKASHNPAGPLLKINVLLKVLSSFSQYRLHSWGTSLFLERRKKNIHSPKKYSILYPFTSAKQPKTHPNAGKTTTDVVWNKKKVRIKKRYSTKNSTPKILLPWKEFGKWHSRSLFIGKKGCFFAFPAACLLFPFPSSINETRR